MKRAALFTLMLCLVLAAAGARAAPSLQVSPLPLVQGRPALVRACLGPGVKQARLRFLGRDLGLVRGRDGCFYGVVAAGLKTPPGRHTLRVRAGGRQLAAARLKVVPGRYGVRRITVSKKFMRLSPDQIARWKRETALIKAVYNRFTPRPLWSGGFIRPLDSVVVGPFGRRSIINGQERSPHGGVDLRGKTGTPVKAPAGGRVALVLDTFFGGNTILIDHGQGLVSVYMHLSAVLVKKGQRVHQGQVIGRVGATGRVTGPHLHFGMVLRGLKIDPLAWIELSRRLADKIEPRPGRGG